MSHGKLKTKRHRPSAAQAASPSEPKLVADPAWGLPAEVLAIGFGLVLLVVAAFAPALSNDFVSWDDDKNFLENHAYRGLGWPQLRWAWTTFLVGVYQPLAWMLLETQYALGDLRPFAYHLTSLVLYALDTVVLFVLTLALLERSPTGRERVRPGARLLGTGLAVALFAVHPLRTEVVAWASCQPYLPCAVFSMLAVLAYLQAFPVGQTPQGRWLVAAFGLFAAALLCKAVAVSLPVVLLILDVYPLRRLGGGSGRWFGPEARRVWWEKIPFVALSLLFMGLAVLGRVYESHLVPVQQWGIAARLAQACYGIWFYALKTVLPWNITAYYPMPDRVVWYEPPYAACILGTLGVSVGLFLLRRRWPGLLAAWLSYLVILAPNLGLVRISDQIAADRYSYIAMMGLVVLLAAGLGRFWQVGRHAWPVAAGLTAVSLGVLLGLIVLSREQCRIWRTSEVLWAHALSHGARHNAMVHSGLGVALDEQGRLEEARAEFAEALRLNPNLVPAHHNLGALLGKQGRVEEARAEFAASLRLAPTLARTHVNLGAVLEKLGRVEEARAEFAEALRLNPSFALAHNNLGALLGKQGRVEEARAEFAASLRLDPDNATTHKNLAMALEKLGRVEEARAEYDACLRLDPDYVVAHYNLGVILLNQGRREAAQAEFVAALRLDPNDVKAHNNLGVLLSLQGRHEEARAELERALRLNPNHAEAHNNLGLVLQALGRCDEAGAQFAEALRLKVAPHSTVKGHMSPERE